MTERRKSNKKIIEKINLIQSDMMSKNNKVDSVFNDVLKLVNLLTYENLKAGRAIDLKKEMQVLMLNGEKFSPFVKRFVLKNLPKCLHETIGDSAERHQHILESMYLQALQDKTLLHVDFVKYQKGLAQKFSLADKSFFLDVCSITERLIFTDSKKTLFISPDERIRAIECEMVVPVSEGVKKAVKKNLFTFKRERIHLSRDQKDFNGSYVLLRKMCQKYYQDMTGMTKKNPRDKMKKGLKTTREKS